MKKYMILILGLFLFSSLAARDQVTRQSLSLSLGGPRSSGYFEYQFRLTNNKTSSLSISGGLGLQSSTIILPIGFVYNLGDKNQMILGLHYVPIFNYNIYNPLTGSLLNTYNCMHNASFRFGYRRIFRIKEDHYFLQAYFSPSLEINSEFTRLFRGFGIGLGAYL